MSNVNPNRPEITFAARNKGVCIEAAVWVNEHLRDGRKFLSRSVTLSKQYYDADTNSWQKASSFYADELAMVRLVVDQAYAYIMLKERETESEAEAAA